MSNWKPEPPAAGTRERSAYNAGYSDGWYGYKFGSGDLQTDTYPQYGHGFEKGTADRSADQLSEEL